jgi:outer membrane lipoprotein SlyB
MNEYGDWGLYKNSNQDQVYDYDLEESYIWHEQLLLDRQWEEKMRDQEFLNNSDIFDSVIYEDEINKSITEELNQSRNEIKELEKEITMVAEIFAMIGKLVYTQGEHIDHISNNIETVEKNTAKGIEDLEKATIYNKSKLVIVRDLALVIGGGVVGLGGFFLGPIIGAGTVIAGMGAGGAAVAGIHKIQQKSTQTKSNQLEPMK